MDFLAQTSNKRFLVEPCTREEFPESFVEQIARKSWDLTRNDNDYLSPFEENITRLYEIRSDWNDAFRRRSLYCFTLMMLDLCDNLQIEIKDISNWRKSEFRLKYQIFYLKVMPSLRNIANNTDSHGLSEDIYFTTRDMFRMDFILSDTPNDDLIAGNSIYGILKILLLCSYFDNEIEGIVKSIIKENIQTILMI